MFKILALIILSGTVQLSYGQSEVNLVSPLDIMLPNVDSASTTHLNLKSYKTFYAERLPLFCKFEHKLAVSSKYNIKMRLGDIDYVDKLEGKAYKPDYLDKP